MLPATFEKCLFTLKKLTNETDKFSSRYQELSRASQKYSTLYNASIKRLIEFVDQIKEKFPTEWQEQLDKETRQEELIIKKNAEYEAKKKAKNELGS